MRVDHMVSTASVQSSQPNVSREIPSKLPFQSAYHVSYKRKEEEDGEENSALT
jgi:hypothetical protein